MRINYTVSPNQLHMLASTDILSTLSEGDTLRVQVVDVSNDRILLRLLDGTLLNALSNIKFDVAVGDFLDLIINMKTNSQLFVKMKRDDSGDHLDSKELIAMLKSLEIPEENDNIVIIQEMKKNHIPITKEAFQRINELVNRYNQENLEKITYLAGKNIIINESSLTLIDEFIHHKGLIGDDLKILLEYFRPATQIIQTQKNIPAQIEQNGDNILLYSATESDTLENNISDSLAPDSLADDKTSENNISNRTLEIPLSDQQEMKFSKVEYYKVNEPKRNESRQLQDLARTVFRLVKPSNAGKLPAEIEAEKLFRDIKDTISAIQTEVERINSEEKSSILTVINRIEKNLSILEQINRSASYLQIPVDLNGQQTTAELFIFRAAGKKKRIDGTNVTALISLSTSYLSRVEVFIQLSKRNVECVFRSDSDEVLQFIRKNNTLLYHLLDVLNYKATRVAYQQITEKQQINLLNVENIRKQVEEKRQSIDIRA